MPTHPMTLTQKILAHHAIGLDRPWVEAGDFLQVRVDWSIASELAWNGMDRTYSRLGRPKIHDPERFYLAVDHTVDPITLANDPRAQRLTELSRAFARESGIRHFYDANETILHTKFYRDLLQPGEIVLGADSHSSSHGGLGAFSIGLGGADITAAMVLGQSWIEVPEAIAVEYRGETPFGISGKEVILKTLGELGRNTVAMARTVEYVGASVRHFSTDMRFTICNMTAEFGGLNGIFQADPVVAEWLAQREGYNTDALYFSPDADAPYAARYVVDLDRLEPQVARPYAPDNVSPASDHLGQKLDGVFIGACTTTEEELVLAALVMERGLEGGSRPNDKKRLVVPGSSEIVERLEANGVLDIYRRAGFRIGPPGCSMCLGVASDKAEPGEIWLTSQNRNFENRMGAGSHAWLASAATVGASALDMGIADARPLLAQIDQEHYERLLDRRAPSSPPPVIHVEPQIDIAQAPASDTGGESRSGGRLQGRAQCFGDHVDTDAIIPGEFCHLTSLEELGDTCFHYVRPGFRARVEAGQNILVAGEGWGSGSSREQAVWALQGAGVGLVIARSYAFIHRRNLVNEAMPHLVLQDDAFYTLVEDNAPLDVDLLRGEVTHVGTGRTFTAEPPPALVNALVDAGGIVPAIQAHGAQVFSVLRAASAS